MTPERWAYIKALKPRKRLGWDSSAGTYNANRNKKKHAYRLVHGARK